MSSKHYSYTIVPLEGREYIQRNFATLPKNAAKYCNRAVTLNERFAIIERGYLLVPDLTDKKLEFLKNVILVPREAVAPLKEKNQQKASSIPVTNEKKEESKI